VKHYSRSLGNPGVSAQKPDNLGSKGGFDASARTALELRSYTAKLTVIACSKHKSYCNHRRAQKRPILVISAMDWFKIHMIRTNKSGTPLGRKYMPRYFATTPPKWTHTLRILCSITVLAAWSIAAPVWAQGTSPVDRLSATQYVGRTEAIEPDSNYTLRAAPAELSPTEREDLLKRKRQLEINSTGAISRSFPMGPAGLPEEKGEGTILNEESRFPTTPDALVIKRNNQNPPTLSQSTLAEPAAANNGAHVLATGNFSHFEFSTNGGSTWTKSTFPVGPSDAPIDCCDNDVIHDRGRGVTFLSTLYTNSGLTHGVVRIFVFRDINAAADCSYTLNPGAAILPDYPHIGKSNNFLYLTTNNTGTGGQAQIRRFNIDQMSDCVTTSTTTVNLNDRATVGQRVVTPAEGAERTMYFSWAENSTQIRVFSWPEANATPSSVLRTISNSNFTNPDCRGGTLNNDFTDDLWASIHGFNRRGAVGKGLVYFYWNVGSDTSHTQGHIHSAIFEEGTLALVAQTPMFISGNTACNGLPIISTNDRGDLGISTTVGGKAGGGGTAAQGYVGIADDFSGGIGFFPTLSLTAAGTHNRTDQRYGDYFVTHRHNPCGNSWTATNYALNDGTATTNVNSRYIEFSRGRDLGCQNEYVNSQPAAQ
jgi:hypothetical protein